MLKDFRQFLLRGSVVDLAVAVVIGAAFGTVVTALTKDLLTPLIAAIVGKPDFSAISFKVGETLFPIQDFINAQESSSRSKSKSANKVALPDAGTVAEGVYRNRFFGFAYKLPYGWVDRTDRM